MEEIQRLPTEELKDNEEHKELELRNVWKEKNFEIVVCGQKVRIEQRLNTVRSLHSVGFVLWESVCCVCNNCR